MHCYHKKKICFSLLLAVGLLIMALLCALISQADYFEDASISSSESTSDQNRDNSAFETYISDLFRREVSASGLTLHYTLENPSAYGITQYAADLGTFSQENFFISAALAENNISVLEEFDTASLTPENQFTLKLLEDTFSDTITAAAFPYYNEPLRPSTGDQAELPVLMAEYAFSDTQDIQDYLEILSGIPSYFDSIITYEREKASQGLFMTDAAAEEVIAQCRDFAALSDSHYLLYTFEEKIDHMDGLSENEALAYREQNRDILTDQVIPAYQRLADAVAELCSPVSAENTAGNSGNYTGLCHFPEGAEYYEYLVKSCTGSSDSVKTLQKRTEEQRASDLTEAAVILASHPEPETDPEQINSSSDNILSASPEEMLAHLETAICDSFPSLSGCNYIVKYVDAAMEAYMAPAFYLTAPLDHFTENSIYINGGSNYEGIQLFTTLAHEGFPGHLYQNAFFCSTDPAPIRALLGPAGYAEGWATYTEMLSYHYAGLSDELADALALEQSAILSLYASADMGIHYDGWSFENTFDFFSGYGFSDENTIREIFELILSEPAHYLKYYIGYIEFLSLKEYAEELFGEAYTDLNFHRTILEMGPAPFPLLKEYMVDFYD